MAELPTQEHIDRCIDETGWDAKAKDKLRAFVARMAESVLKGSDLALDDLDVNVRLVPRSELENDWDDTDDDDWDDT